MFRLSRDVRFAIDLATDDPRPVEGRNGFAGKPPVTGIGQCYYRMTVTVAGQPAADTGYLVNIKDIDESVRRKVIPLVKRSARRGARGEDRDGGRLLRDCFEVLRDEFQPHSVEAVELHLTPFTSLATSAGLLRKGPVPMVLLHHTFEFAASHRLHNPAFSDEENSRVFGKCNNPHGHGHNYTLRVTLRGEVGSDGLLGNLPDVERIVDEAVIEPFDHKHLNTEVPEFHELNPSVENIAKVIYRKLAAPLTGDRARLDSVTVWETPKTWCEYSE